MPTLYKYYNYVLPLVTQANVPSAARVGSGDTPGRSGSYAGRRYLAARQVKLSGVLIGTTYDELQNKWSQLQASHNSVSAQPLFCGLEDRFLYAYAESIDDTSRGVEAIEYDVTYLCHDPYFYSASEQNISVSTPTTFTISTNGNVNAVPQITVNISAAPAASTITLNNTTTGESFTLRPTTTGPIFIDSRLETVLGPLLSDQIGLFSGNFVSLAGGPLLVDKTSSITVSTTGDATVSSVLFTFRDRFI